MRRSLCRVSLSKALCTSFHPPSSTCYSGSSRSFGTFYSSVREPDRLVVESSADEMPQYQLKTPKGTKDWQGRDMVIRDKIFSTITAIFKRHGAVTIDTPVFELKEILAGKYGEDSKLIYDLADQGGEACSLRYDLTVPFARWLAMNSTVQNIKRYHLAKVYRRDQPAMTKGRMREFYQCDFDIAGTYDPMLPDAEILRITCEIFDGLGWDGNYTIKINHRKILDGIFKVCGVPQDKLRQISSAVDKLDKLPWADVYREMTEEKGLDTDIADKIGTYVQRKSDAKTTTPNALLEALSADPDLAANESAQKGLADMGLLFTYLSAFGVLPRISFDMSLARGLDYYTGVIYEVVTEGSAPGSGPTAQAQQRKSKKDKSAAADEDRSSDPSVGVGSVAAGGRYDELVGMFSGKAQIPCVGISFGVDRIFSIVRARMEAAAAKGGANGASATALRSTEVEVFVMAMGTGLLAERLDVCKTLWDAGVKAEFSYKVKPKFQNQFKEAERGGVPFAVMLGEDELKAGKIKIKQMGLEDGHPEKDGVMVDRGDLVKEVRERLRKLDDDRRQTALAEGVSGLGLF